MHFASWASHMTFGGKRRYFIHIQKQKSITVCGYKFYELAEQYDVEYLGYYTGHKYPTKNLNFSLSIFYSRNVVTFS